MQPSRIELMQRMPVFGAIRSDAVQFLLDRASTVEVAAGGHFFRENDQAHSMFVLETGAVAVVKHWRGREQVIRHLDAGDCFGEMALMDLFPRSATVVATQDCRAIELAAAHLLDLFDHDAEQFTLIQMNIGREVCRRLRATDELLFRALMGEAPVAPEPLFRTT